MRNVFCSLHATWKKMLEFYWIIKEKCCGCPVFPQCYLVSEEHVKYCGFVHEKSNLKVKCSVFTYEKCIIL